MSIRYETPTIRALSIAAAAFFFCGVCLLLGAFYLDAMYRPAGSDEFLELPLLLIGLALEVVSIALGVLVLTFRGGAA